MTYWQWWYRILKPSKFFHVLTLFSIEFVLSWKTSLKDHMRGYLKLPQYEMTIVQSKFNNNVLLNRQPLSYRMTLTSVNIWCSCQAQVVYITFKPHMILYEIFFLQKSVSRRKIRFHRLVQYWTLQIWFNIYSSVFSILLFSLSCKLKRT